MSSTRYFTTITFVHNKELTVAALMHLGRIPGLVCDLRYVLLGQIYPELVERYHNICKVEATTKDTMQREEFLFKILQDGVTEEVRLLSQVEREYIVKILLEGDLQHGFTVEPITLENVKNL